VTPPEAELELTGERTLPGIWHENYWFRRHEAAYRWIGRSVRPAGAVVVDAGSGEGYGADLLVCADADLVVGVDIETAALRHMARAYDGVRPLRANLVALPMRTGSVDVVVAAQVVEHLWDQPRFVAECARVLRTDGHLVVTTPNRRTFPPGNPFHSRELDPAETADLVATHFDVEVLVGLHHGPRLRAADSRHRGIVAAQLLAPPDRWPDALSRDVRATAADDFVVGNSDGCLDVLVIATRR
jgi:SAM-dependent methyltransferase